jgi:hypothetical protein
MIEKISSVESTAPIATIRPTEYPIAPNGHDNMTGMQISFTKYSNQIIVGCSRRNRPNNKAAMTIMKQEMNMAATPIEKAITRLESAQRDPQYAKKESVRRMREDGRDDSHNSEHSGKRLGRSSCRKNRQ